MHVVVVESPAKCKTIHKYLGNNYRVLPTYGHVRDLPNEQGRVLPEADFAMRYEVGGDGKKKRDRDGDRARRALDELASALDGAETLILATDPDREGEAISWHVLEALRAEGHLPEGIDVRRVVFNSITRAAITQAIRSPRGLDMDLVNAQQARRAIDYLVGFNITPVLWRKLPGAKSAGRVQSVALRLICDREDEIEAFRSQEYWSITAAMANRDGEPFSARLAQLDGRKLEKLAIADGDQAHGIVGRLRGRDYRVAAVEAKQVRSNPAPPFITSTLQQEASRKLGFPAKRTMSVAQALYEAGWITYMRTDGVEVAPEAVSAARAWVERAHGKDYLPDAPRQYKSKAANAQEAHEAIRPTELDRDPARAAAELDRDHARLYELVWKRMVASQMASAVFDRVAADIADADDAATFRANGSTLRFDGFLRLYREDRDDSASGDDDAERRLPDLAQGDPVDLRDLLAEQHFTEPPPRFTEASLVKRLEELGIGRPSTYASIISILQERNYVRIESKRFVPEPRGRVVTAFLKDFFSRYVQYEFTAHLEGDLDKISAGDLAWKDVLRRFWGDFSTNVEQAMGLKIGEVLEKLNHDLAGLLFPGEGPLEQRRRCPKCGSGTLSLKVSSKPGSGGAFVGCSNYPECRYTRELTGEDDGDAAFAEPRLLGEHPHDGLPVTLHKGPYGFYVQKDRPPEEQAREADQQAEADGATKTKTKKPKAKSAKAKAPKPLRSSLPPNLAPDDVDLPTAVKLLELPRDLGEHPETGKPIKAGLGRFGPYLLHDGKYTSLKQDDVLTIARDRALEVLAQAPAKGRRAAAEPLRTLGEHPQTGEPIAIFDGRYGHYIKHAKTNAPMPKDREVDQLTLEEAVALVDQKAAAKPTKAKAKTKTKAKASTAKAKAASKTSTKTTKARSPRKPSP